MKRNGRRMSLWGGGVLLAFAGVFVISLGFFLSSIVNSDPVRGKILSEISKRVEGEVTFGRIDLSLFPRPHLEIHEVAWSLPDRGVGKVKSLSLYPNLLALLRGRVQIREAKGQSPAVHVHLPAGSRGASPTLDSLFQIRDRAADSLIRLSRRFPDVLLKIEGGLLVVQDGDEVLYRFEKISGSARHSPVHLDLNVSCVSSLWEGLSFRVKILPESLDGSVQIDLIGLQPHLLVGSFPFLTGSSGVKLEGSTLDLSFHGFTTASKGFSGRFRGSLPQLLLESETDPLVISCKEFSGRLALEEGLVQVVLDRADFDFPRLGLSGNFSLDQNVPLAKMEVLFTDAEIGPARQCALALAGRFRTTHEIFSRLRGGIAPRVIISAQGSEMRQLLKLENIFIQGTLRDGDVLLSQYGLYFQEAATEVTVSEGVLESKEIRARVGRSAVTEGKLMVGLQGPNAPLNIESVVEADLSEMPPLLRRLSKSEGFLRELARIDEPEGRASGQLSIRGGTSAVEVEVKLSRFDLKARYGRVPALLEISGGRFSYDQKTSSIGVEEVSVRMGASSFSEVAGFANWTDLPLFEVTSAKGDLEIEEVLPWLLTHWVDGSALHDFISATGGISVHGLVLKGPLFIPQKWDFKSEGEVRRFHVDSPLLPSPLQWIKGGYRADLKTFSLRDAEIQILDASLTVSGDVEGYLTGVGSLSLSSQGKLGPRSTDWISDFSRLPEILKVRPPLILTETHLAWEKGKATSISGGFMGSNGPRISLAVNLSPGGWTIEELVIQDKISQVHLVVKMGEGECSIGFRGELHKETVDDLLVDNPYLGGWIKGDYKTKFSFAGPPDSSAEGLLEGRDLYYPWKPESLFLISKISLGARKEKPHIASAHLSWEESHAVLQGDFSFSTEGILVMMDATADTLKWDSLRKAIAPGESEGGGKGLRWPDKGPADGRIKGRVNLHANSFEYGGFTWSPLRTEIHLDESGASIRILEGAVCGVSTPGVLKLTSEGAHLDFTTNTRNQDLETAVECLFGREGLMTGKFRLEGFLTGEGRGADLMGALHGQVTFKAKKGRIYQLTLLSKLFAVLNLTEIFRGKVPDLVEEGFGYKSMKAEGDIKEGKLELTGVTIDGSTMGIACKGTIDLVRKEADLTFLVSPLKTVDVILQRIPLIRDIFEGHVVSIPIRVLGPLENPEIIPLSPSAVGSELFGLIKRTLMLPLRIIQPLLPKEQFEGP